MGKFDGSRSRPTGGEEIREAPAADVPADDTEEVNPRHSLTDAHHAARSASAFSGFGDEGPYRDLARITLDNTERSHRPALDDSDAGAAADERKRLRANRQIAATVIVIVLAILAAAAIFGRSS